MFGLEALSNNDLSKNLSTDIADGNSPYEKALRFLILCYNHK